MKLVKNLHWRVEILGKKRGEIEKKKVPFMIVATTKIT